jgi:pimeloyl-ACP methyl ester carboxylesterase
MDIGAASSVNRIKFWVRRVFLGFVAIVFLLAVIGLVFEAIAERADLRAYPPPGQMIDVGGRQIHMLVTGPQTGKPTVILEAGIASFSSNWVWVQQELSSSTRVVSYDRAGLGWSDPAPKTQDAQQSATDLHTALQAAGVPGPYVVVGHSYGGLVVRAFADLYLDEVVGMVQVDASHPNQWSALSIPGGSKLAGLGNWIPGILARFGVVRLLGMDKSLSTGLPEQQAAELEAALARPQGWFTSGNVIAIWDTRTRPEINQARPLGDLPLVVLSAPERPGGVSIGGYADLLNAQQAALAELSSNSLHLTVDGATHEDLVGEEVNARVVAQAIQQVIEAAQTGDRLSEN